MKPDFVRMNNQKNIRGHQSDLPNAGTADVLFLSKKRLQKAVYFTAHAADGSIPVITCLYKEEENKLIWKQFAYSI